MFRRLILPLAFRSFLLSIVVAGIVCIFAAPVGLFRGEQTMSGTLRDVSAGLSWTGAAMASSGPFDPRTCAKAQTCDVFTLKLDLSDEYQKLHPDFALSVGLTWDDPQNDFDLYLSKDGRTIEDSSQGQTNSEELRMDRPANGIYHIYTHAVSAAAATPYNGRVRIVAAPLHPPERQAQYQKDPDGKYGPAMFQFAPEVVVDKAESKAEARSAIAIDSFGNTYIASDGSDLAVGAPHDAIGAVYVKESPQWIAALGTSRLYVATSQDSRLLLRRSDDGGETYRHEAVIIDLTDAAAAARQGNLVTNRAGTLIHVFGGRSKNEIYLTKCVEPCERFVTRRIFGGGVGFTVDHPYPVVAIDHAGGLHVVFSDGQKVFLISSADGGATWKDPAVVNNPNDPEAATGNSPWVFADDSGRVGVAWLGWRGDVYYAFTPDSFAPVPTFDYVKIGDAQPLTGLPSGAIDPFGNANVVYGHTHVMRQIGGERLIFGPYLTAAGTIKTESGLKRIGLSVRQDFSGSLTYLDEQRRLSLQSTRFTFSKRVDQNILLGGLGRLQDGNEVSFVLSASDSGTKRRDFTISMSNGYFATGVLQEAPAMEIKLRKSERRF